MSYVKKLDINSISYDIKSVATEDVNTGNAIKIWTGTRAEYDAITTKDGNTLYNTDNGLFLGTTEVANKFSEVSATSSRNVGEIVMSTVPLSDAGLHLLNGVKIYENGIYDSFYNYIVNLYNSGDYLDLFVTEANWKTSVATYGVCGKFVVGTDNEGNFVRLPKIFGFTEGTIDETTIGDLTEAGLPSLPSHTHTFKRPRGDQSWSSGSATNSWWGSSAGITVTTSDGTWSDDNIYGNSTTVQPQSVKVLYYIVVAATTKTDIEVDIDEIATDLNGKADVDLTNINNSCKALDGQWVASDLTLASSVTYPTSTNIEYDVSSYLPNDNYNYEVLLGCGVITGTTSGNAVIVELKSDILTGVIYVCGARTRASSSVIADGCVTIPIGTGRKITIIAHSSYVGTYSINLRAYRRIGTNS